MSTQTSTNRRLITKLRTLVKDLPVEVLGHVEAPALCCGSGTVALVKIDTVSDPAPKTATAARKK